MALSPGFRALGGTDAVEILVFLIWQLLHWLYLAAKTAKTAKRGPRATLCQCCRPEPAVLRTGPHRLPNRCSAKLGETAITSETCLAAQISK